MLLIFYVNDIVIVATDIYMIQSVRNLLKVHFDLKELGPVYQFLGFKVIQD